MNSKGGTQKHTGRGAQKHIGGPKKCTGEGDMEMHKCDTQKYVNIEVVPT